VDKTAKTTHGLPAARFNGGHRLGVLNFSTATVTCVHLFCPLMAVGTSQVSHYLGITSASRHTSVITSVIPIRHYGMRIDV
jgi:hypothetical protein